MHSDGEMESIYKEVLRWRVASREIEEEVRERVQATHRLGFTCVSASGSILLGIALIGGGALIGGISLIFLILGGIFFILGGIAIAHSYYSDEKYLNGNGKQEDVRVKTVLLHEVISELVGMGRNAYIKKYLKISYPMEGKTIVRELSLSDFSYDINLLGNDLAGLYGKKITLAHCRKEFYILNHVYLEFDEEEQKPEERTEWLKNAESAVKNLVDSIDEKQIGEHTARKKLAEEFKHQFNYKMFKYILNMFLFVDSVIGYVYLCSGMHGVRYLLMVPCGITIMMLMLCFMEWVSCKKHSGRIWSKKKLRRVHMELGKDSFLNRGF